MDLSGIKAVILSCKGPALSAAERRFFRRARPLGFILFARNCRNPAQLRRLSDDLRECLGRPCPILIDQEGGRVQRLKPPGWRAYPPMRSFGDRAAAGSGKALAALRLTISQMAAELAEGGVNVNCAPVLDVLTDATHAVIGDRAFAADPDIVARAGLAACRYFLAAGITPVIKHLPGHGRGKLDSHKDLPRVSESLSELRGSDFKPFSAVSKSDIGPRVWGMTAHIVYDRLDPDHPASASSTIIREIIRGEIGFAGFLLSDDLDMAALAGYGDAAARAAACIAAGCDAALYCAGELRIMEKIAASVPELSAGARKILQKAAENSIMGG